MMAEQQPLIHFTPAQVWTNKHQNVSTHIERLYEAWNRWSDRSHPDQDGGSQGSGRFNTSCVRPKLQANAYGGWEGVGPCPRRR